MDQIIIPQTEQQSKPLIQIPEQAVAVHEQIVAILGKLEDKDFKSCLDSDFKKLYSDVMVMYDKYQKMTIGSSGFTLSCQKGCAHCCYHWVEDVNSFEAEIIAEYITSHYPERVSQIIEKCQESTTVLTYLENLTLDRLKEKNEENIDHVDLVLSVFYQMKKPCPFLLENHSCGIYDVRPLTCRIYLSFSEPALCLPDYQDNEDIPTYLLNLEENASAILDRLHFKYQRFQDDSGLRSMVMKYLTTK